MKIQCRGFQGAVASQKNYKSRQTRDLLCSSIQAMVSTLSMDLWQPINSR